eukprot:scaffold7890_cov315-Pinguiococcus_pyrenoidosus.AAC.3
MRQTATQASGAVSMKRGKCLPTTSRKAARSATVAKALDTERSLPSKPTALHAEVDGLHALADGYVAVLFLAKPSNLPGKGRLPRIHLHCGHRLEHLGSEADPLIRYAGCDAPPLPQLLAQIRRHLHHHYDRSSSRKASEVAYLQHKQGDKGDELEDGHPSEV